MFSYNKLESAFLITAITILLCGMIFKSGAVAVGGPAYIILTVIVAVLILGAIVGFLVMLGLELYRSCKFAAVSVSATDMLEKSLISKALEDMQAERAQNAKRGLAKLRGALSFGGKLATAAPLSATRVVDGAGPGVGVGAGAGHSVSPAAGSSGSHDADGGAGLSAPPSPMTSPLLPGPGSGPALGNLVSAMIRQRRLDALAAAAGATGGPQGGPVSSSPIPPYQVATPDWSGKSASTTPAPPPPPRFASTTLGTVSDAVEFSHKAPLLVALAGMLFCVLVPPCRRCCRCR